MFNRVSQNSQQGNSDQLPVRILKGMSDLEQTLNQILSCAAVGAGVARNMAVNEKQQELVGMGAGC